MSKATVKIRVDRIALLRSMRELDSDYALAEAMGISQANLSRVLRGQQSPGPRFIGSMCHALAATQNDLFQVVETPQPTHRKMAA